MLNPNVKGSEVVALVARIAPVSQGVGSVSTGWVAAKDFHRFMAIVQAGVLGAAATLDGKIEQATSSGGAGVKDVVGRTSTQLVKATDDNKEAVIDLKHEDLDHDGGFAFVRLTLTVAAAASLIAGQLLGIGPVLAPASDNDASTVKGIT